MSMNKKRKIKVGPEHLLSSKKTKENADQSSEYEDSDEADSDEGSVRLESTPSTPFRSSDHARTSLVATPSTGSSSITEISNVDNYKSLYTESPRPGNTKISQVLPQNVTNYRECITEVRVRQSSRHSLPPTSNSNTSTAVTQLRSGTAIVRPIQADTTSHPVTRSTLPRRPSASSISSMEESVNTPNRRRSSRLPPTPSHIVPPQPTPISTRKKNTAISSDFFLDEKSPAKAKVAVAPLKLSDITGRDEDDLHTPQLPEQHTALENAKTSSNITTIDSQENHIVSFQDQVMTTMMTVQSSSATEVLDIVLTTSLTTPAAIPIPTVPVTHDHDHESAERIITTTNNDDYVKRDTNTSAGRRAEAIVEDTGAAAAAHFRWYAKVSFLSLLIIILLGILQGACEIYPQHCIIPEAIGMIKFAPFEVPRPDLLVTQYLQQLQVSLSEIQKRSLPSEVPHKTDLSAKERLADEDERKVTEPVVKTMEVNELTKIEEAEMPSSVLTENQVDMFDLFLANSSSSSNILDIPFPSFVLDEIVATIDPLVALDRLPTMTYKSTFPERISETSHQTTESSDKTFPEDTEAPSSESTDSEEGGTSTSTTTTAPTTEEGKTITHDTLLTALNIEAALSNIHVTLVNASVTHTARCEEISANINANTTSESDIPILTETIVEHTIEQTLSEEEKNVIIAKTQADVAAATAVTVTDTSEGPAMATAPITETTSETNDVMKIPDTLSFDAHIEQKQSLQSEFLTTIRSMEDKKVREAKERYHQKRMDLLASAGLQEQAAAISEAEEHKEEQKEEVFDLGDNYAMTPRGACIASPYAKTIHSTVKTSLSFPYLTSKEYQPPKSFFQNLVGAVKTNFQLVKSSRCSRECNKLIDHLPITSLAHCYPIQSDPKSLSARSGGIITILLHSPVNVSAFGITHVWPSTISTSTSTHQTDDHTAPPAGAASHAVGASRILSTFTLYGWSEDPLMAKDTTNKFRKVFLGNYTFTRYPMMPYTMTGTTQSSSSASSTSSASGSSRVREEGMIHESIRHSFGEEVTYIYPVPRYDDITGKSLPAIRSITMEFDSRSYEEDREEDGMVEGGGRKSVEEEMTCIYRVKVFGHLAVDIRKQQGEMIIPPKK